MLLKRKSMKSSKKNGLTNTNITKDTLSGILCYKYDIENYLVDINKDFLPL